MPENMIYIMCDDLGYGDTGFNGSKIIKTPHLDKLAQEGAIFTQFYAGAPVCSPTRGTCLTGRHHFRYGITHANDGVLPKEEITIQQIAHESGYVTGHFGKWHLGTLTNDVLDGRRGGRNHPEIYAPPWERDFDVCFSTEVAVPLWNDENENAMPIYHNGKYWTSEGVYETKNLHGDDSRVIMDRALPFIENAVKDNQPFLAVIWFHAPHSPVVAGPMHRKMYEDYPEHMQHYFGCITAMDEQVGRLNDTLKALGVEDNTCVWFCSDNGPEGDGSHMDRYCGSTGGLRGRKRSLFNGGINVPAIVKWPKYVKAGTVFDYPASTLDYLPTLVEEMGYTMPDERPIDGISLLDYLSGTESKRQKPIPFRFVTGRDAMFNSPTFVLIDNDYKVLTNINSTPEDDMVFDINTDRSEAYDMSLNKPQVIEKAKAYLKPLLESFERSHHGGDYDAPDFKPVRSYIGNEETWRD